MGCSGDSEADWVDSAAKEGKAAEAAVKVAPEEDRRLAAVAEEGSSF